MAVRLNMRLSLIFLCFFISFSCQMKKGKQMLKLKNERGYALEENNGIFTELFDSTNTSPNRYTENNTIYCVGTEFIYSFKHIDTNGKKYYYQNEKRSVDGKNQWSFVSADSINTSTIQKVKISVKYGLEPMLKYNPNYNQTLLKYEYPIADHSTPEGYSISGAIENEKNVWIHPPRDSYFKILELNPFPFIKHPYEIGHQWNWQLTISDGWADKRWKIWEGKIENQYEYEIVNKIKFKTKIGSLDCYVIESKAYSNIGETKLTAYFNKKFGFVKLDYTNIDKSKTILELTAHKQAKKKAK